MEIIDIDWCKQNNMAFVHVNVARDMSYYLEKNGNVIFVYTESTTGEKKLYVRNPITQKECELTVKRLNKDLTRLNVLTTDDLYKLCELVEIENLF